MSYLAFWLAHNTGLGHRTPPGGHVTLSGTLNNQSHFNLLLKLLQSSSRHGPEGGWGRQGLGDELDPVHDM